MLTEIFIWLMFLIGLGFHVLFQVESIVAAKNNPVTSRLQIFSDRRNAFLIRSFINLCLFGLFLGGGAPELLSAFRVSSPEWLMGLHAAMHTSGGPFVAGLVGYTIDSLLAFIPMFKSYVPVEITEGK